MRAVAESDLRREVAVTTAALDRAEAAERLAIENRYASDIRLAHTDMEAGRAGPARALLDGLQPTPGQPDLRGWEWRFLSQRAAGNQSRTLVPPGTARAMPALAFDGARRLLAAPAPGSTAGMWRWSIDSLECTALRPDMSYRIDLNLFLVKRGENVRDWARSAGIPEPAVSELETEASERRGDKWGAVDSMSLSANGEWLATGGPQSQVRLWKWPDSRFHQALPVTEARVVFSPRGDWLAIAGRERATGRQSTWLLSFPKDQSLEAGRILPGGPWNLVAWDPAGEYLATASPTGEVAAWDAATLSRTPAWSMSPHACALAVFPGGQRLAVNPNGWRVLEMRRATDGRLESTLGEHSAAITAIALSRDGRRFATASQDNTVHVRESATGASIMRLEGHAGPVKALAWLSDENLATAGNDGTVRLWSVGGESGQFKKLPGLRNAEFSPDSARVAGIGNAGELLVTDPVTLKSRTLAACRT